MPGSPGPGALDCPRVRNRGGIRNPLVVGTPHIGLTQEENGEHSVDQQHIFDRVARFLAAITGPSDAFGSSCPAPTKVLTSASLSPRRFVSSVKDRVGASPGAGSVAWRTTNRT
jgi:hypothetical protein